MMISSRTFWSLNWILPILISTSSKRHRAVRRSRGIPFAGTGKEEHMATALTTDILRDLGGFRAQNGCAISIYLDLDPSSAPTTGDIDMKFKSILSESEKAAERRAGDRECRLAVREDIDRIRDW